MLYYVSSASADPCSLRAILTPCDRMLRIVHKSVLCMQELEKGRAILSCRELYSLKKTGGKEHDRHLEFCMLKSFAKSENIMMCAVTAHLHLMEVQSECRAIGVTPATGLCTVTADLKILSPECTIIADHQIPPASLQSFIHSLSS